MLPKRHFALLTVVLPNPCFQYTHFSSSFPCNEKSLVKRLSNNNQITIFFCWFLFYETLGFQFSHFLWHTGNKILFKSCSLRILRHTNHSRAKTKRDATQVKQLMLSFQQITTVTYTQNLCAATQVTRNAADNPSPCRYWLNSQWNADCLADSSSQTEFVMVKFYLHQRGPEKCKYGGLSFTYTLISLLY